MECEICGKNSPKLFLIEVEGSQLRACSDCFSVGKMLEQEPEKKAERIQAVAKKQRVFVPSKKQFDLGLDIVSDYGQRVRQARNKKGLTREELAKKIFEKASIIEKIERHSLKPSDELIKKLENFLNISLRESSSEEAAESFTASSADEKFTLEHFIKKKK